MSPEAFTEWLRDRPWSWLLFAEPTGLAFAVVATQLGGDELVTTIATFAGVIVGWVVAMSVTFPRRH